MRSHGVVIGLVALTLGATAYVAVSMPKVTTAPAGGAALESGPGDRETARAIEELRTEIQRLGERMDQRLGVIERQVTASESPSPEALAGGGLGGEVGAVAATEEMSNALAAKVAESVQTQLDAKLERLASRQRNRNMGGEWKAPIDELADELELSDVQKETATAVFDDARDEVFDLLKSTRPDGGSLLDDLVTSLRKGDPDALQGFIQRIFSERIPGGERTYVAEMISLSEKVRSNLSSHLSAGQMEKLKTLNVAVLEVETGYDPVEEYITNALSD